MFYIRIKCLIAAAIFATICFGVQDSHAVQSQITAFTNTITKLEVSRNSGKTWTTVFDNNTTSIDLVTISGQSVGTVMGAALVPSGTYNRYRVTIATSQITFRCNDDTGGGWGNLIVTQANMVAGGGVTFPLISEGDMNVTVNKDGTVDGKINFKAASSYSSFTFVLAGAPGSGNYILTGLAFNPDITIGAN